jgi:uncharacterized protein (DUF2141 family)
VIKVVFGSRNQVLYNNGKLASSRDPLHHSPRHNFFLLLLMNRQPLQKALCAGAFIVLCCLHPFEAPAQQVTLKVTDIKSTKGKIIVIIFKDNKTFEDEKAFRKIEFSKEHLKNGAMELHFTLEPGIYGITLLDDEDGNGVMNKNFIGIPKEGFGFSNYYLKKMARPHFDEFKTKINKGENTIIVKVKYV